MPIRWNKNGERYTNGNLRIQRSTRSYSVEIVAGKTFRPYNPSAKDIFHLYDNGQYIGQTRTLGLAKEKLGDLHSRMELSGKSG